MKKLIIIAALLITATLSSCRKECTCTTRNYAASETYTVYTTGKCSDFDQTRTDSYYGSSFTTTTTCR